MTKRDRAKWALESMIHRHRQVAHEIAKLAINAARKGEVLNSQTYHQLLGVARFIEEAMSIEDLPPSDYIVYN